MFSIISNVALAYDLTFERYIQLTRFDITAANPNLAINDSFVDLRAPFILQPPASCSKTDTKGVVMVHGLLDFPYRYHDLGPVMQQSCYLVYSILLPGHGTKASDLIDIKYQQWQQEVKFAVDHMIKNVGTVYLAGYSLGGLLVTDYLISHPK
ncbi:MAG: alpha/beta hydrolase [Pseudomonadota bacterium]